MSAYVLVTGTIFRAPERRIAKTGRPFATATIRAREGDETQWWKVRAFSESVCDELLRLQDGDAVSVQGRLDTELYEKGGEQRIGLSVTAEQVNALRAARKPKAKVQREPATKPAGNTQRQPEPQRQPAQEHHALDRYGGGGADPALDDEIPF